MSIPRQSAVWDTRRNTSAVHAVPPTALPAALSALAAFRRQDPALALVTWIEAGHPTLTEPEHEARFGESFAAARSRKASAKL